MSSSTDKSFDKDKKVEFVNLNDHMGYTIGSMTNSSYRQLQQIAKSCGLPSNLKKEVLKMVIKAKMNGHYEEVQQLLKQVKEARLLRRKQKSKTLEKFKPLIKSELMEGNNNWRPEECANSAKHTYVRKMMHNMVKMKPAHNVTIQQTSTHTRYRAVITPSSWRINKCGVIAPSSTTTSLQSPDAITYYPSCNSAIRYTTQPSVCDRNNQGSYQANHLRNNGIGYMTNEATATAPDVANQRINPQFSCSKSDNEHSYMPRTAVSVRETLLQQYHRNPIYYEPVQRIGNTSWTGGMVCHHSNVVSSGYQPLPSLNNQPYINQPYNGQSYNQIHNNNQICITNPESDEIACCQSRRIAISSQASHQCERPFYGEFQPDVQRPSVAFNPDDYFIGTQCSNEKVPSNDAETSKGLQLANASHTMTPFYNIPNKNQLTFCGSIPNEAAPSVIDVTNLSSEPEHVDTDLGILANMATAKAQEITNGNRSHQYNHGVLMIDSGSDSHPFCKDELTASDTKPLLQNVPTWNNFLKQMSNNLSPCMVTGKGLVQCRYGCHMSFLSREQQVNHEEHCPQQPYQCPMVACTFVGQLRSITTHVLNDHANEVKADTKGLFFIDFADGKCLFQQPRSSLKSCPKNFCYPQFSNGRLFFIKVIGNFDSMQVIVYVQYVNDFHSWKSFAACEVVRQDGLPYQWTSEVLPVTYSPVHIITRRKCLIFNMNKEDFTQNLFVLHTKIMNVT